MDELTLDELFPGATQDATTVTIPKSALSRLTALAVNTADQIFAGINARGLEVYPIIKRDGDSTATPPVVGNKNVSIVVQLGSRSISQDFETGTEYQEQTITINFYKLLPSSNFDPDDY